MMLNLCAALGFLTILPTGRRAPVRFGPDMLVWFPVAGAVAGALWYFFDALVGRLFPDPLRLALDLAFWIILTGALHLDGLADTADGLLAHRGPEKALAIMKDSRTGVWGALALIVILGLKAAALAVLLGPERDPRLFGALTLAPALARWGMVLAMGRLPYGRGQEGLAHALFGDAALRGPHATILPALYLAAVAWIMLGAPLGLRAFLAFALTMAALLHWYRRSMGCLTGDMLGALGEVTETAVLIALAA